MAEKENVIFLTEMGTLFKGKGEIDGDNLIPKADLEEHPHLEHHCDCFVETTLVEYNFFGGDAPTAFDLEN